jgi:ribokinase
MQPLMTVFGDINVDLTFSSAALPRSGDDIAATAVVWGAGGAALNTATAAARLGAQVRLIGRIGRDPAANLVLAAAAADGIDCRAVEIDEQQSTGLCAVLVTPGGERSFVSYRGANLWCDGAGTAATSLVGAQVLYIGGHALLEGPQRRAALAAADLAEAQGIPIVLDLCLPLVRSSAALIGALLPRLWIVTMNEAELQALLPDCSAEAALQALQRTGVAIAAVKRGARGCSVICADGERSEAAAPTVAVVDTTACGDAFSAAFSWGLLRGAPTADAATIANTVGALTATRPGVVSAMPTQQQIRTLLEPRLHAFFAEEQERS